jgi:XTP/dITP diphosphohydrolase
MSAIPRRLGKERVVIASHNPGKVREIAALLAPLAIDVVPAAALGLAEPEETGDTFAENALIKARSASLGAQLPALADDSGLVVPALGGEPGVHSARWGGPEKDFTLAMAKVEAALAGKSDRRAHFTCALALAWPDGAAEVFEGHVFGRLVWPPRGDRGFGYDPIFVADGMEQTFGEIDPELKYRISHRAAAFRLLLAACLTGDPP